MINSLSAQSLEGKIQNLKAKIDKIKTEQIALESQVEDLQLQMIQRDLEASGLPAGAYLTHSAMMLSYEEAHEQARWVAHIIPPEVIDGTAHRSNDFREDPLVATGTAVEADYFLKKLQGDGVTYDYDGFGYDRGHLAPSADFRWSAKALSESYFYSNMSPQRPNFNRVSWAELEGKIRGYIFDHPKTQLYVVTGPILKDNLPVIERSINKVSIPEQYFKVILDLKNEQAIGFLMPNHEADKPLKEYAVSIDEIEALTGLDFFNKIPNQDTFEKTFDANWWLPNAISGEVEPLHPPSLPKGHFNTVQAKMHTKSKKKITVCGTVVSTRYSRSGNLWLNLDKKFPNQIFSVYIPKKALVNFSYDPEETFSGKTIKITGKIQDFDGVPTMRLEKEEDLEAFFQKEVE